MVDKHGSPKLHVVLRRNTEFGMMLKIVVTLTKLGARLSEDGLIAFGRAQRGLIGGGPKFSRLHIAQINKCPPAVARRILAPPGDREIAPAAVAATLAADGDMVATLGQEVNFRSPRRRICADPHAVFAFAYGSPRFLQLQIFGQNVGLGFRDAF